MAFIKLFAILVGIFACTLAFPQPQDAEVIPSNIPKGESGGGADNDDGFVIINMRPVFTEFDPLHRIFRQIFRSSAFPFGSRRDQADDTNTSGIFPSIFDRPLFPSFSDFPRFPDFPNVSNLGPEFTVGFPDLANLPDNYDNTTHEVKIVNGTRMEVNRTISKSKDDNGVFVQEVHIVRFTPENNNDTLASPDDSNVSSGGIPAPLPEQDTTNIGGETQDRNESSGSRVSKPSENEIPDKNRGRNAFEDFGIKPIKLRRNRRWVMQDILQQILDLFKLRRNTEKIHPTTTTTQQPKPLGSYLGDTKVNYLENNRLYHESDAEIFDPSLFNKDKEITLNEIQEVNPNSQFLKSEPERLSHYKMQPSLSPDSSLTRHVTLSKIFDRSSLSDQNIFPSLDIETNSVQNDNFYSDNHKFNIKDFSKSLESSNLSDENAFHSTKGTENNSVQIGKEKYILNNSYLNKYNSHAMFIPRTNKYNTLNNLRNYNYNTRPLL